MTAASSPSEQARPNVLDEASSLINGDRRASYGNAFDHFADVAALWSVVLGAAVTAEQVCLCLVQLKVARLKSSVGRDKAIHRDSLVDLVGYAALIERTADERGESLRTWVETVREAM